MHLSPNFTLAELTRSQTATRRGIDNTPPPAAIAALGLLCVAVLEPVRALVGGPIVINSGYRGPVLNGLIGGSGNSQHMAGQAADIERPGLSNWQLAQAIAASTIPFDQLILEAYVPGNPGSGWVHISHRASGNRRALLTATPQPRAGMRFTTGLQQ